MNSDSPYMIREAVEVDLARIHEIEVIAFQPGWSYGNLEKELGARLSKVLVAEIDGTLAGYISAWLVSGEIQINRLAVLESHRRRGVASRLVKELIGRCAPSSPFIVLLEVRERNASARSFYRALGFVESSVRKGYYTDDNAVLLEKHLPQ